MYNKKRGQAAMEFLMTYGWAILVVLVVIGALAYFGVLNPQSFLPKKCQFTVGLVCEDHVMSEQNGLMLKLNNGLGKDIVVKSLTFDADNNIVKCRLNISSTNTTIPAGNSATLYVDVESSSGGNDCAGSSGQLKSFGGTRIKGPMVIEYIDLQTQFPHKVTGTLLTDVEDDILE